MSASSPCLKRPRLEQSGVSYCTARPTVAIKTEEVKREMDDESGDDVPVSYMRLPSASMDGASCPPTPRYTREYDLPTPEKLDKDRVPRPSSISGVSREVHSQKPRPSRAPSKRVDAVGYMDMHVANEAPSPNVSPSTHVEEAASSNEPWKNAKDKQNAFQRQLRRAPPDVVARWNNELVHLNRNDPNRYAFGISRTTWNTRMCFVVTCDCCFVAINIMTCGYRIEIQSCSD